VGCWDRRYIRDTKSEGKPKISERKGEEEPCVLWGEDRGENSCIHLTWESEGIRENMSIRGPESWQQYTIWGVIRVPERGGGRVFHMNFDAGWEVFFNGTAHSVSREKQRYGFAETGASAKVRKKVHQGVEQRRSCRR